MRALLVALLVLALAAGCTGAPPPKTAPPGATASPTAPAAGAPAAPTSFDAPAWRAGDWWRWRIESVDAPAPFEVTTIVASVEGDSYRVGVAELEPALRALVDHVIVTGVVQASDLAWVVHDKPARVLSFPLSAGATWMGTEEGRAMRFTANATRATGPDGEVDAFEVAGLTRFGPALAYTYAPSAGHFLRYSIFAGGDAPYATATLLAHGAGRAGALVLESDDAFATFAGTPRVPPRAPSPEVRASFEVPANATHVLLACFAGGVGEERAEAVAPAASQRVSCRREGVTDGYALAVDVQPAVPGAWTVTAAALGGFVGVEVYLLRVSPG